jgi:hypothetical protein
VKADIRSGRSWVPPEWRQALELPFWRGSAIVAVTGVRTREEAADVLAGHLPMIEPDTRDGGDDDLALEEAEDTGSAARIARRLSRWRMANGVRELVTARIIHPHYPAVYAWRRAAAGETAYRIWPDGSLTLVSVFHEIQQPARDGQTRTHLTATRFV